MKRLSIIVVLVLLLCFLGFLLKLALGDYVVDPKPQQTPSRTPSPTVVTPTFQTVNPTTRPADGQISSVAQ